MTQLQKSEKMQKTAKNIIQKRSFFYKITKKKETKIFAFWVITFEPNKIKTRSAPQNDSLNLSFVKDGFSCSWRKND